ncbi:ppGpp synthetase catalytic domain-containing protein (RelA/SpoT-type nucleotidyltranferase) [Fulvimarina manganoxydans]|uniref:PpGpp synthetase catalytic domain-containing protein (RelA/SpoT-type nucleotidyltranferase) n=1 Tax=Fulvimarina manganoxydans TaxID=937218 RepID=A0A1W1YA79_9HYPH|nr:RelA/SpoT domain-containing protein [Fulvimarina manganoxydans]SMC32731.1 ppGpp synthetase catalytic domain-containing protein (RelA/SpoT-type nucleotidyltranferase) [Fulvimarina manganoxydans]
MTSVRTEYTKRHDEALGPIANKLDEYLRSLLVDVERVDRISTRPKSIDRFVAKAEIMKDGKLKYDEPLHQIQDQIGARIITFYTSDVERIAEIVLKYFRPIESRNVVPQKEWEFGYFGKHHILLLPMDVVSEDVDDSMRPACFELQIKTLFQHAWSEANHDLGYKPGAEPLNPDENRQLAFTSAQAWGADRIFNELFEKRMQG